MRLCILSLLNIELFKSYDIQKNEILPGYSYIITICFPLIRSRLLGKEFEELKCSFAFARTNL